MNIDSLKEKLGDETYTALKNHIDDLIGQRDAAKKESIDGRKNMKARLAELEAANTQMLQKLGVDSLQELDALPDAKGQADAVKQFEVKLKRLEQQLQDKDNELSGITGKFKQSQLDVLMQKALSGHDFVDSDLVAHFAKSKIEWDGDEPHYKTDAGTLVSLADGVTHLAKEKPHLLKAQGAGGSGFGKSGGSGKGQKNPWAQDSFNLTEQIALKANNPGLAAQLEAAAAP